MSGALGALSDTKMIYMECPIITYNKGAPSIQDYLDFMRSKFFIPVDVLEIHRSEGVLLQIDIMFLSKETHDKIYGKNVHVRPFE